MSYRIACLLSAIAIIPLGYWVRFSTGLGAPWFQDIFGSLAYEVFWIVLVMALLPRAKVQRVAIAVCLASCAIEVLQLWQPPFLQALRATLPGRLVLGNTFNWFDFPPYFVGSYLGFLWVTGLQRWQWLKK